MGNGFAERYARYLLTKRNLVDSAVHKNLFRLKHFLTWAIDNGYPVVADPKKFSWQHREQDILTLTRAEVQRLSDLDLNARPALDNARALFLIGDYTGLRFSNVAALLPEYIQADHLRVTTQKPGSLSRCRCGPRPGRCWPASAQAPCTRSLIKS